MVASRYPLTSNTLNGGSAPLHQSSMSIGGTYRAFSALPLGRRSQKIAWQILSEEVGNGDLAENHVWVYQQLMASINTDIGTGDER